MQIKYKHVWAKSKNSDDAVRGKLLPHVVVVTPNPQP